LCLYLICLKRTFLLRIGGMNLKSAVNQKTNRKFYFLLVLFLTFLYLWVHHFIFLSISLLSPIIFYKIGPISHIIRFFRHLLFETRYADYPFLHPLPPLRGVLLLLILLLLTTSHKYWRDVTFLISFGAFFCLQSL